MKKNITIIALLAIAIAVTLRLKEHNQANQGVSQSKDMSLPRLLDLGSHSCIPCKMMAPILDEMRDTFSGELLVEFIDVRLDQAAAEHYGVRIIPTQIFFDEHGNELARHEGFYAREEMLATWSDLGYTFEEAN